MSLLNRSDVLKLLLSPRVFKWKFVCVCVCEHKCVLTCCPQADREHGFSILLLYKREAPALPASLYIHTQAGTHFAHSSAFFSRFSFPPRFFSSPNWTMWTLEQDMLLPFCLPEWREGDVHFIGIPPLLSLSLSLDGCWAHVIMSWAVIGWYRHSWSRGMAQLEMWWRCAKRKYCGDVRFCTVKLRKNKPGGRVFVLYCVL